MIELVIVVVIYWTECMPRKFGNEIRLPGTTGIDNLPIPLTPPGIPGLVQTNITNSAEEKWALLDKDIEMEDSETENEDRNGRTILHHTISLHYNVM